jgi:glycosyltransferase involved in cell wall biosynthesis
MIVNGFPSNQQVVRFLTGLTHVISCELFYNHNLPILAQQRGIKSYLCPNYEFADHLVNPNLPLPTKFLAPSYWHLEELQQKFPGRVEYLPPPTFHQDFMEVREKNLARSGHLRFVHIVGKRAAADRNGTLSVIQALKYTNESFELVIKAQHPLDIEVDDHRVRFDYTNPDDQAELYQDFDVLIMPRRYGGLSLPMCEALMSALPVIMTDISPNNQLLPLSWLVPATKTGELMTRTMIDLYEADAKALAAKIDEFCAMSDRAMLPQKTQAFALGYDNFSSDVLKPKYLEILK